MTEQEQAIWNAAYAVAFVAEFRFYNGALGFDAAAQRTGAETARNVADLAVQRNREWIAQEGDEHDFTFWSRE